MKPLVRKAPEGAFRYLWGIMDKPFKTYDELLDFLESKKDFRLIGNLRCVMLLNDYVH